MNPTERLIKDKIDSLERDCAKHRAKGNYYSGLADNLEAQIKLLRELLPENQIADPLADLAELNGHANTAARGPLTPSNAVREFIRQHPGTSRRDIIRSVAELDLESTVRDPEAKRGLIASVLNQQFRRDKVRRTDDLRYYIKDGEGKSD